MSEGDHDGILPPRANPALVGHEDAERLLAEAYASGRLHHAVLITGPKGIGKATLAFRFARFVLAGGGDAQGRDARDPSPLALDVGHPVFRRVASGGHADLRTLERTIDPRSERLRGEIVVSDVREAGRFLRLSPAEAGWRVVVVDSVDEMNTNAANAMLKFLEEPPPQALILLVSHRPGRLIATIRSRCRRLELRPLGEAAVLALLAAGRPQLSAAERATLARLSEGRIGRALELADSGGAELYREMTGVLGGLPRLDVRAIEGLCDRIAGAGAERAYGALTSLLLWWLGRLVRATALAAWPEDEPPHGPMRRLADGRNLDRWLEAWEKINRLFGQAEWANLDKRQVVVSAFLALEGTARPRAP
ncbi:MAG: DNA polymerase III subunit delta' [Alphaproteobacteria bacterium]